jgi:aminopeptidase N
VRALIGTFAAANPTGFNRPDGTGYAFIADAVLELDRFNPQMAARLAGAFKTWRQLESRRRALVESELGRISGSPDLSRDCFEIISKTLA